MLFCNTLFRIPTSSFSFVSFFILVLDEYQVAFVEANRRIAKPEQKKTQNEETQQVLVLVLSPLRGFSRKKCSFDSAGMIDPRSSAGRNKLNKETRIRVQITMKLIKEKRDI